MTTEIFFKYTVFSNILCISLSFYKEPLFYVSRAAEVLGRIRHNSVSGHDHERHVRA